MLSNSVTVRHVPLTEMLSPSWTSVRIEEQLEMVREVPFPPVDEESRGRSAVTAAGVSMDDERDEVWLWL